MWDVSLPLNAAFWQDTTSSPVSYGKNGERKEGRVKGEECKAGWRLCMAQCEPTSQGDMAVLGEFLRKG